MRISTKYGFTFLCMPKCASTSIEKALTPYCQLITQGGNPGLKHTSYRKYKRFLEPFVRPHAQKEIETVCIMREPISWLHSWYRYRKRDKLAGTPKSTIDMDFNKFCELYMENEIKFGRRLQFDTLRDKDGNVGVDKIFPYENLELAKKYFEEKIGKEIDFPQLNVSKEEEMILDDGIRKRLIDFLQKDYEVYNSITKG